MTADLINSGDGGNGQLQCMNQSRGSREVERAQLTESKGQRGYAGEKEGTRKRARYGD